MKNALRIGSAAGIGIYLHWTFLVLVAGIFMFYLMQGNTVAAALGGVGFVLAAFVCVVLHEFGHALAARYYGVPTRDITLYPIGGVARLMRLPEEPVKELWIAVAGPAVNLVIAAVLAVAMLVTGQPFQAELLRGRADDVLGTLLWINLVLVAFNLLPAFPMDGGRVLRALLAMRMDYARATEIAANVGQGMAILFGLVGLIWFNPVLMFIALFVYIGAQQEARQAMMRALTQGISVRHAMMTRYQTLSPDDRLGLAIEKLLAGSEHDFPVLRDGALVGILTRTDMMRALSQQGPDAPVGEIMHTEVFSIEESAMLEDAFTRMQANGYNTVPVTMNDRVVGVLTLENVGELLMISSALRQSGSRFLPDTLAAR